MVSALSFAPHRGCRCGDTPYGVQRRDGFDPLRDDGTSLLQVRDVLSLASSRLSIADDGSYEQTGLKLSSRSIVRVGEEGQLSVRSDSRLRFRYEFESADGTKISVQAKAKLQYAYRSDGSIDTESLKLNVKFGVSVLQQNVSDGLNPLLDESQLPDEVKDAIAAATQLFQTVSDSLTSAFQNAESPDGDALVTSLVDAFNQLAGDLQGVVLPTPPALPQAEGTPDDQGGADQAGLPEPVPTQDVPANEESASSKPVIVESVTPPVENSETKETDTPVESSLIENIEPVVTPTVVEEESTQVPAVNESQAPDEAAAPTQPTDPKDVVNQALLALRVRFVASLQSLTQILDGGESSTTLLASRFDFRASIYSVGTHENAGVPPANLDVQA